MAANLRLEYVCSLNEIDEGQSLMIRAQLGRGSKWKTSIYLWLIIVGMLLGGWFRFKEIPEPVRALLLAAVVAGSVAFVLIKKRFRRANTVTTRLEVSENELVALNGDSRVAIPWSAFSGCFESPGLFVLRDRSKQMAIIIPKRAFPDESSQDWFRDLAARAASIPETTEHHAPVSPASGDHLRLTTDLKFRDHLASTCASWRTWGFCIFMGVFLFGLLFASALNPPKNVEFSPTNEFVYFALLFYLPAVIGIVMLISTIRWRSSAAYSGRAEYVLSEESLMFSGNDGNGVFPWSHFEYFMETPWSFFVWRGPHWLIFPKRAFSTSNDINRCRELLDFKLKQSRWFCG